MSQLQQFITTRKQQLSLENQTPLSMTHVIYGYPSVEESLTWMKTLLDLGVDLLEVQFPFSDPVADGPTIVNACHKALTEDLKIKDCLSHLKTLAQAYPNSKIVFMSYLNPIFKFGITTFIEQASLSGISGIIIPDLAIENAQEYQQACDVFKIDPIWLVTPITPKERLKSIAQRSSGLLYCVSRSGVTGGNRTQDIQSYSYINDVKCYTQTPLAIGFGIRSRKQVEEIMHHADIAIIGSALLDRYDNQGATAAALFVKELFPHLHHS